MPRKVACPRCKGRLSDDDVRVIWDALPPEERRSLWAAHCSSERTVRSGGRNAPGWPKGKPRKPKT